MNMKHKKTRRIIYRNVCNMLAIMHSITFLLLVALMPTQSTAYLARRTGCFHNGTWYAEKSYIPTQEKCLTCECKLRSLVCRLKICPEIPMPPPRGCIVVQKRNSCCPYLSCARLELYERVPATRRIIAYLDHYERESIDRVVNDNMLQRRSSDDNDIDMYVCVKNGTVYKSGSAMSSSNLCTYCYCIGGSEKCVKPKCMLPVDGCKPIFVDSTCCPVRYDCSTKVYGKSSQEVNYQKINNKHFQRMSQGSQRNRGCTMGQQFYAEGQKIKSDIDKPCDICFCIRGLRRCAPKKCAPPLKNCLPVVPKGQCCPSSYDCDYQRDYRRADNSRQFNLFSIFFNDDEANAENTTIPAEYPHDRKPTLTAAQLEANKKEEGNSFFDKIRQGLEFIDINNEPAATNVVNKKPDTITNKDELSLLDLLLEPETDVSLDEVIKEDMQEKTTIAATNNPSWLDLLLGADENKDENLSTTTMDSNQNIYTTQYPLEKQAFKEIPHEYDDDFLFATTTDSPDILTSTTEYNIESITDTSTNIPITVEYKMQMNNTAENDNQNATTTTTTTTTTSTEKLFIKLPVTTKVPAKNTMNESVLLENTTLTNLLESKTATTTTVRPTTTTTATITAATVKDPEKTNSFLSAILNGITTMLGNEQAQNENVQNKTDTIVQQFNSTATSTTTTTTTTTTKPAATFKPVFILPSVKPLPLFKPLPVNPVSTPAIKTHTRINSKLANFTMNPNFSVHKHNQNQTAQLHYKTKTASSIVTVKPLPIKTILEAEPLEQNVEPTLPPSLPNLKIIPFLPTDAVKADRNKATFENYYNKSPIDKIDYDLYDNGNMYPSLTESFPTYDNLNDDNKAEYIYKFNIEGPPVSTMMGPAGTMKKGFLPPTKTEGGFVPKEPIKTMDNQHTNIQLHKDYQPFKYFVDITTSISNENSSKIIEITTPDIFKDVIRTEPPPALTLLIEDQVPKLVLYNNTLINKTTTTIRTTATPHTENSLETYAHLLNKLHSTIPTTTTKPAVPTTRTTIKQSTTVPSFKTLPTNKTIAATTSRTSVESSSRTTLINKNSEKTTVKNIKRKTNKPQPTLATTTTTTLMPIISSTSTTKRPLTAITASSTVFQSPFDKLPFMDTSFEIKMNARKTNRPTVSAAITTTNIPTIPHNQTIINLTSKQQYHLPLSTTEPSASRLSTTSRVDPFGALKLAGCNIYGRMYRVDRIIVELSNKCRECKCTEVGVECKRLDC